MTKAPAPLTDRERILMHVIRQLDSADVMCRRGDSYDEASWKDTVGDSDRVYTHFARYRARAPLPGDLVIAMTSGPNEYSLGWWVEPLLDGLGGGLIREIGSTRTCRYSNEQFTPIVGLSPVQRLEGSRYQVYLKVQQAFRKGGEYTYRFGGIDFDGDNAMETKGTMHVTVREAFGGLNNPSEPFKVTIPWTKRTSVKAILAALRAGGYGTKSFRPDGWVAPVRAADEVAPSVIGIEMSSKGVTTITTT